jgi:transposase InsO family protein
MFNDVEEYITNCKVCQKNKFTGQALKLHFRKADTQFHPWDKLYLDIVGSLPMTDEGHKYILTCQDNLSKYLIAISIMMQTAEEVALTFMRYVILQYGIPYSIVTDQGTQFMGDVFKRLCKLLNICKLNTSAYRPEINGALERAHKTMIEYLR